MAVLSLAENHKDFLMRSDINRSKKKKEKKEKRIMGRWLCMLRYKVHVYKRSNLTVDDLSGSKILNKKRHVRDALRKCIFKTI